MSVDSTRLLLLSAYYWALGKHDRAKALAKESLLALDRVITAGTAIDAKRSLELTLEQFDSIAKKVTQPTQQRLKYISSKIHSIMLLPWPAVPLQPAELWPAEGGTFVDPEFTPTNWANDAERLADLPTVRTSNPSLAVDVPDDVIHQAALGDCSVVASLLSIYELRRRSGKDILLWRLYPQCGGVPVYASNGRYIIQLPLGGVERLVEIDDLVPVSRDSVPVPKHAQARKGSLWPALFEKAYLKTQGGYDFSGSHAAVDTFQLTGWIPVYIPLSNFHIVCPDMDWDDLFDEFYRLWCDSKLILCIGTGQNAPISLIPQHDYAVVGMRTDPPAIKIVNPWDSSRDESSAAWHAWSKIRNQFHMLYLNRDSALFAHKAVDMQVVVTEKCIRGSSHNLAGLPQLMISSDTSQKVTIVAIIQGLEKDGWSGYLSLRAYSSDQRLISDAAALLLRKSPDTSSLCSTLDLELPAKSTVNVTAALKDLVTTQRTAFAVFSVYSEHSLKIFKAEYNGYQNLATCVWTPEHFGGTLNDPRYHLNPQYSLDLQDDAEWLSVYLVPKDNSVPAHLGMFWGTPGSKALARVPSRDMLEGTGPYTPGIRTLNMRDVAAGSYVLIASLFEAKIFSCDIIVQSSCPANLTPLVSVNAGWYQREHTIYWRPDEIVVHLLLRSPVPMTARLEICNPGSLLALSTNPPAGEHVASPCPTLAVTIERELFVTVTRLRSKDSRPCLFKAYSKQPVEILPVE